MALILADRVQETSTSPGGTGSLNLAGAVIGFQPFSSGIGTGNETYYCIFDTVSYAWEVGIGTYTSGSPDTLSRTTILSNSSGTTSAINFTNGNTLNIFCTYPSEKSINYNIDGVAEIGAPLGYSDTGIIASFVSTETDYNQVVVQNKSTANTASANFNVSNDAGSDTANYAEFGINSSTFAGDSSFDLPGAAYLSSATTPLTIGTYGAHPIHFITNGDSTTTDAMTIYDDGSVTLGGLPASGIGNISCNNINLKFQQVVTSGGTTTLTNASPYYTQFTGTSAQDLVLPDATTCLEGTTFIFDNDSTQNITIKNGAGTSFEILVPGGFHTFILEDNSTVAGTWLRYSQVPSTVEWGTYSLTLGATVISGGTWEGGTIQPGYGGTGLTTFTSANNALYSTGASTLTAGTLPVAAGGTGATTLTANGVVYGNGTSAAGVTAAGTTGQVLVGNTGAAPSWATVSSSLVSSFSAGTTGFTPNTATTGAVTLAGTLNAANGGTGLTSPGTSGNVLTSNGTDWVSQAPVGSNKTTYGLYENANTISANYTITTNNNAMSAGPITVDAGVTVTVPSGSNWVVL